MKKLIPLIVLFALAIIIWSQAGARPDGKLRVDFLNVGQGDAIYFKTSTGEDGLFDGGPNDNKVLKELGSVMPLGDRQLSLVVATHPDADHIGGLVDVINRYQVDEIWLNGAVHTSDTYLRLLDAINQKKKHGTSVKVVVRGDRKDWGTTSLQVLAPFESYAGKQPDNQNDGTIVARLAYKDFNVLLTGDAEFNLEDRLIANTNGIYPLQSTILKVGHHGSGSSTSAKFLEAVAPKAAVISVGKDNRYGHPVQRVLDLLTKNKIPIYRTDKIGTIKIISDGESYQCVSC